MMKMVNDVISGNDLRDILIVIGLLALMFTGNVSGEAQSVIIGGLIGCLQVKTGRNERKEGNHDDVRN